MAKIDCSVTVNFLREWGRMCEDRHNCSGCALRKFEDYGFTGCKVKDNPEFTVEIVQKWSDEHPVKTRLEDLLEKYPNIPRDGDGLPDFSPGVLDYCRNCLICRLRDSKGTIECWHEPVDGGATGKAVE